MTRQIVDTPAGPGWIDVDRPARAPRALLVLGHGAGGGVEAADLAAVRAAALEADILVARVTQPYRVAGRRAPAPAPTLDLCWLTLVAALKPARGSSVPLVVGGRSSGARVACRTADEAGAVAVVALAFPLHPPGRPDRTRIEELGHPSVPILIVQGERDPFGMPPRDAVDTLVVVAGADHGLKKDTAAVADAVVTFVCRLT